MTAAAAATTTKTKAVTNKAKISRWKKILIKIRRFYRRGITECAGQMSGGEAGNPPHLHNYSYEQDYLPRIYSVSSTSSSSSLGSDTVDYRYLLRAASDNSIIPDKKNQPPEVILRRKMAAGVGRSQSAGPPVIGRIDEDEACEFEDDVNLKLEIQPKNKIINGNGVTRPRVNFIN